MNGKKLKRLLEFIKIAQSGLRLSPDKLAEALNIHKRTLSRYIRNLRDSGVPVYHDKDQNCYLIDNYFFLQPLDLNFDEALGLHLLAQNLLSRTNTFFEESALTALIKIIHSLPDNLREQCCDCLIKTSTCSVHQAITNLANEANVDSSKTLSPRSKPIRIEEIRQSSKKKGKASKSATF